MRLGDRNFVKYRGNRIQRKYPRLIKLVFNNERAANVLLRNSKRLHNHQLLGNIYIKRDKTQEERIAEYAARRRAWRDTVPVVLGQIGFQVT